MKYIVKMVKEYDVDKGRNEKLVTRIVISFICL